MALNQNIVVRLSADTTAFNANIKAAGANAQQLASGMEASGKKTSLLTTGLAAAGAAATAFGVMAVNAYRNFDSSMSGVQSATNATASEMDLLREAAISAGADTIYSATESADAITELGKAGLGTSDILSGGLSGALNLAASDGMAVADAAELMASTLAQFNLTGQDATRVADALAAGAGSAQGSAHDLGMALSQVGMVANLFGISMEETTGSLSAFANAGMIGSDAGTSLKSMLIELANPSSKAAETMQELGINAYDAQGNFIGLANLAGELQEHMSTLTQEQRNQALATIFGSDAIRAANVLYNEGAEGIAEWTDVVSESGFAAEMAAAKNDNLNGDLENLSGSFESLMISIGAGADGPLRSIVQTLDTLVDGFSSLPAPVQQTIIVATAAVGGFTALHKALTPLNGSTSNVARAFGLMVDPMQRLTALGTGVRDAFEMLRLSSSNVDTQLSKVGTAASGSSLKIGALKSVAGGIVGLMGGPWGVAFALAGAALMEWVGHAQEAEQRADNLKSAMETTGDATEQIIDNLTNAKIDNSWLVPDGLEQAIYGYKTVGELLDDVGIKMSDMALAAQGNSDALARVKEVTDGMVEAGGTQRDLAGIILSQLDQETEAYNDAADSASKKKQAMDEVASATDGAASSTDANADALDDAASAADDYKNSVDELVSSLFSLENERISAYDAQTRLQESISSLTDTVAQNGATVDINAEAGRANRNALADMASQALDTATAILEEGNATGDMTGATETARASLECARTAFINAATACGMTREDAEALASQFGLTGSKADQLKQSIDNIPSSKTTNLSVNGLDDAIWKVSTLNNQISTLHSKDITIRTNLVTNKTTMVTSGGLRGYPTGATGGLFDGSSFGSFAGGGEVGTFDGYVDPAWAPGTGLSDSVYLTNARIAAGEYVENAKAVEYYGTGIMRALNERAIPREWFDDQPTLGAGNVSNVTYNVTQNYKYPTITPRSVTKTRELNRAANIGLI